MIAPIAWREFRTAFASPLAWALLAVVQFLAAKSFLQGLEDFRAVQPQLLMIEGAPGVTDLVGVPTTALVASLLLFVVPLLTMRAVAGERLAGTLTLLRSSPITARDIVLGKYLGLLGVLIVLSTVILLMPLSLVLGTTPDWGKIVTAGFGLVLMAGAFAAVGIYFSTLVRQPLVAALLTLGLLLLLWVAGTAEQRFVDLVSYLSLVRHYQPMLRGTLDSADVAYYVLFSALFLGLAVQRLDAETASPGWRLRVQNWAFVALFVALVATTAWLSTRYAISADWSAGNRNTLSDTSRAVVGSFDEPVTITAFARDDGPLREQVAALLARYAAASDAIRVEFVNPDLEPSRTRAAGVAGAGEMVVEHAGRLEHVLTADERALTQALQRVARGGERLLVFTAGHGERDPLGPIAVLVNNAADDARHDFRDLTADAWNDRINVNLRHVFFATQAVFEHMRELGGGSVVNFGSMSWYECQGGMTGYTTSKAGIEGLTRGLAAELGRQFPHDLGAHNIRINTVVPGWVMTPRQLRDWVDETTAQEIDRSQCLKRRLEPDDLAAMVLFLASDDSRMCTAQSFIVDGGWI